MPSRSLIPPPSSGDLTRRVPLRTALRRAGVLALLVVVTLTGGCDRLKAAITGEKKETGDRVWRSDSTLLANKPAVLFRVIKTYKGQTVAPIALIGAKGFRRLNMGNRGWRAFDLEYLQEGNALEALRGGRVAGSVRMKRGMWNAGGRLDSIHPHAETSVAHEPECQVPAGLADVPAGVTLLLAGGRPTLNAVTPISEAELSAAISKIPTLIAPSLGIATSMISRYQRDVHVMNTGTSSRPSILVTYNDPQPVSDTLSPVAQRPRQFIVILDRGVYGYRPSFTFATLGNAISPYRMTYLDYLDVDSDGKAELFFGIVHNKMYDGTIALRFEGDTWRQVFLEITRCQVTILGG